jgi:transketolase
MPDWLSHSVSRTKRTSVPAQSPGAHDRTFDAAEVARMASRVRLHAARMVARHGFGYLGQALSSAELISTLCSEFWRPGTDRFVLSPAHYIIAAYAVGVELGLLSPDELETYGDDGSRLEAIGTETSPVVDMTCGSLGQGLSCAAGFALADRLADTDAATYALLSDGEMQEGQVWEAALFSAHQRLGRLTVLVDCNNSQVDGPVNEVIGIEPLLDKWQAFGWDATEVDGHEPSAIHGALESAADSPRPGVILARTSVVHGIDALPAGVDGHFIKLPEDLASAVINELEGRVDA